MLSQAADFCSILTCATMFAFSHSLHVLVKVADKDDETYSYIRKDICFSENETVPEQLSDEEKLVIEEKKFDFEAILCLTKTHPQRISQKVHHFATALLLRSRLFVLFPGSRRHQGQTRIFRQFSLSGVVFVFYERLLR